LSIRDLSESDSISKVIFTEYAPPFFARNSNGISADEFRGTSNGNIFSKENNSAN
jgi:hypothetical protein